MNQAVRRLRVSVRELPSNGQNMTAVERKMPFTLGKGITIRTATMPQGMTETGRRAILERGGYTDAMLVKRVQRGEKAAFDLLVLRYQRRLTKVIAPYIRDPTETLDVVQESFLKAYRGLSRFQGGSAFYTWLYRIAVNTAKNHLISRRRRPPNWGIDSTDPGQIEWESKLMDNATPEHLLLTEEIERTVMDVIEGLPEDLRTALTLRELEGLSYQDIARVMGTPLGTVRSRIFRARTAINERLRPLLP